MDWPLHEVTSMAPAQGRMSEGVQRMSEGDE